MFDSPNIATVLVSHPMAPFLRETLRAVGEGVLTQAFGSSSLPTPAPSSSTSDGVLFIAFAMLVTAGAASMVRARNVRYTCRMQLVWGLLIELHE